MILLNAFSLNMVDRFPAIIGVTDLSVEQTRELVVRGGGLYSAVGHAETAAIFSEVLGMAVPVNRASLCLRSGMEVIVGQYRGPRLPEGATHLPEGATIQWLLVTVG